MPRQKKTRGFFGISTNDLDEKAFPLSQAPSLMPLKVVKIRGEYELCSRIAAMGIQLGSVMKVRRIGSASCLAQVARSRQVISLGGKVADRIWVTSKA